MNLQDMRMSNHCLAGNSDLVLTVCKLVFLCTEQLLCVYICVCVCVCVHGYYMCVMIEVVCSDVVYACDWKVRECMGDV